MELGAVLEAVEGHGSAEAVERVLAQYNEEHRTIFRFDPADEDKRKVLTTQIPVCSPCLSCGVPSHMFKPVTWTSDVSELDSSCQTCQPPVWAQQ